MSMRKKIKIDIFICWMIKNKYLSGIDIFIDIIMATHTNIASPEIINSIKFCLDIKQDFKKYYEADFVIEGTIERINYGLDGYWHGLEIVNSDDSTNHKNIIKNGEYEYPTHRNELKPYFYNERLSKKFDVKNPKTYMSNLSFGFDIDKYKYVVSPRFVYCRKSIDNEIIFIYDCISDSLIDLNTLLQNMLIKIDFYTESEDYVNDSIPHRVKIHMDSFGRRYILIIPSLDNLFSTEVRYIYISEMIDGEEKIIFSACDDYYDCSIKPKINCKINFDSKILHKMAEEIKHHDNKIKFVIDVLNKYPLYDDSPKLHYDGTYMITSSGKKILMTKEIYNELKDFDEETIIKLINTKNDTIVDNKKQCHGK